ncbi:MAG: hypothetical protein NC311_11660 [Muribaculaceae bacterium]|nr:hypothetical protein [Muribaculaceae bacterium]
MAKGRGIAELIIHLSHLTPIGWGYLSVGGIVSYLTYSSSKKIIPYLIKRQAKKYYPQFEWIIIPHGYPLSGFVFLLFFAFLGYFCESEKNDDVFFFSFMAWIFGLFGLVPILFRLRNQKSFMRNNNSLFMSKIALLGIYERVNIKEGTGRTYEIGKDNNKEEIIEFETVKGKRIRIKTDSYAVEGIERLKQSFNI